MFWLFTFRNNNETDISKREKIFEAAKSKIGRKVGHGWCYELIDSCLKDAGARWEVNPTDSTNPIIYGERINKKELKRGDIILYYWNTPTDTGGHYVIVYCIAAEIMVMEQNVTGNIDSSKVLVNPLPETEDDFKAFHWRYYRAH